MGQARNVWSVVMSRAPGVAREPLSALSGPCVNPAGRLAGVAPSLAGLPGGPPQGPPTEYVEVQMVDGLAGLGSVVDDDPIAPGRDPLLARQSVGNLDHLAQERPVLPSQLGHPTDVVVGDDQEMDGCLGMGISKRGDLMVLMEDHRWAFFRHDPAKNAGRIACHGLFIPDRPSPTAFKDRMISDLPSTRGYDL